MKVNKHFDSRVSRPVASKPVEDQVANEPAVAVPRAEGETEDDDISAMEKETQVFQLLSIK
jgi:hypothetical protein